MKTGRLLSKMRKPNLNINVYGTLLLLLKKINQYLVSLLRTLSHTNLALLQTYGPNAWRIHNYLMEETAKQTEKALEDLKQLTVDVNRERKNSQVSGA